MPRRRLVVLFSTVIMLAIGAGAIGSVMLATQSERGRDWIRRVLQSQLASSLEGTVYLGTLTGSFITDLTTDSLVIRDKDDSVFVATGPIRVTFDPRDLIDGRFIFRTVEITRPFFAMRQDFDGVWSHDKLWPRREGVIRIRRPRTAFGSVVVIEDAQVEDGEFILMRPWNPADSLQGVRRDSAAAKELADARREVGRAGPDRYVKTRRWRDISLELPRVRLMYPDSAGRVFDIARLDVVETDPPFVVTNMSGQVRWIGDSIWLDIPHFDLPGSTGSGGGKIVWGSDLPIRYDIAVRGDSVSLSDVAWIDDAIPTSGGGNMLLEIRNRSNNLDILDYRITEMDVRSHRSRLRGRMTWGIGGPVTQLREVDIETSPMDFALLERFNQGAFPYPFRGAFTGRVRARGGPLNRFVVDEAALVYRDANVPGAVSRARGQGELDVLSPANAVFRAFDIRDAEFDLRTAQFLNPEFPRLAGVVVGGARLDSIWNDVRVSDADVVHVDGDAPRSRLRGSGRLTTTGEITTYSMEAATLPLSFTALAKSYSWVPLRGEFSGPLQVNGSLADLFVESDLVGDAGRIESSFRVDALAPGYSLLGRASISGLDPRRVLDDERIPVGELTGRISLDLLGDSLAELEGVVNVDVDRSLLDGARVFSGVGRLRFTDGFAVLDTMHLETSAIDIAASGALGLRSEREGTLRAHATVDSLGGLRRWLAAQSTDTLAGRMTLDATMRGWLRNFAVDAAAAGDALRWRGSSVQKVSGTAELSSFPQYAVGTVAISADTVVAAGLGFSRIRSSARLDSLGGGRFRLDGTGSGGAVAWGSGDLFRRGDSSHFLIDSLAVVTDSSRWLLAAPALIASGDSGFVVDSLVLRTELGSTLMLAGETPSAGSNGLRVVAHAVPLTDIGELLQLQDPTAGELDLSVNVHGTKSAPEIDGELSLRNALIRGIRFDTLKVSGLAAVDQLKVSATLGSPSRPTAVADLTLPLRVRFDGSGTAFVPGGSVSGRLQSDSVGFDLFERWTTAQNGNRGTLAFNVALGGTWINPTVNGRMSARNGTLTVPALGDVRWRNVRGDVAFFGDSIVIDSISATSSVEGRNGRAVVSGWVTHKDRENPAMDLHLTSRGFHALARPDVADIDISGALQLSGAWREATLRGDLTADRAIIDIPLLSAKDVISLDDMDQFGMVDTVDIFDQRRLPSGPSRMIENLTVENVPVRMGREVWIRSSEANVNLGGQVNITRGRIARGRDAGQYQLALNGPLQTVRGTYRLNVGPVRRTFEVQGGEIRFFGDPDNNPALDITGLHIVRQYSQQGVRPDVRVMVRIGGTLAAPTAELSTPDSVRVTNADLISYLVTGGPSYEITGRDGGDYTSTAARVLLSSLGSYLGGKAAGGLCDDAQVSTASMEQFEGGLRDVGGSILSGTRFSCAKQLTDRAFVRLDAGLCQVGQLVAQGGSSAPLNLEAVGVKFDYLIGRDLTASAGVEPPTSAVLCSRNASARGFVPTPQQIGFDIFRSWRF